MSSEPIVTTKLGVLRGQVEQTSKGTEFYSFLGIQYAQPPLGKLRFKAPLPPKPWEGIRDATTEGDLCYHKDVLFALTSGSEDCLYLNVFTPELGHGSGTKKPVMVWIHGGGYMTGSGKRQVYGPEFLIEKDIVLITMNYRLGALGFLSLKDEDLGVLGNAALKDQHMALTWIQANISEFGGDPNNVTIFGESSGGASVNFHLVSPMSKGLFHKAIMSSGVGRCCWAEGSTESAYDLVKALGIEAKSDAEVLNILQGITKEELVEAQLTIPDIWKPSHKRAFCPIVEKHGKTDELFLPDYALDLIKAGKYHKVPVIIGANSGEGLLTKYLEKRLKVSLTPEKDEDFVPHTCRLDTNSEKCREIGEKIREFYYGDQEPSYSAKSILCEYMGDAYFVRAILDIAENLLKTNDQKVFLYQFCMKSTLNVFSHLLGVTGKGTCHVDDVYYLFKSELTPNVEPNSIEYTSIDRMTTWWTNFAKYSNPNGINDDNSVMPVKWANADHSEMQYMVIAEVPIMKANYHKKNNDFWKSIESMCVE